MRAGEFNNNEVQDWIKSLTNGKLNLLNYYTTVEIKYRKVEQCKRENMCLMCLGAGFTKIGEGFYICQACKGTGDG